jgi:hypothetical protein
LWRNCNDTSWIWRSPTKPIKVNTVPLPTDCDVVAEQELVLSGKVSNDLILLKKLTKVYDNGKVAVDNLSLGVAPGECFGLLGINGKIIVSRAYPSSISIAVCCCCFSRQLFYVSPQELERPQLWVC